MKRAGRPLFSIVCLAALCSLFAVTADPPARGGDKACAHFWGNSARSRIRSKTG